MRSQLQDLVDSIHRPSLSEPPAELRQFARKETLNPLGGGERRRDRRYSLIMNVIVVPLDKNFCTVGQPFIALSSGMSVSGIRLIHSDPSPSENLFLVIDCQPVRFVLTVLRSRPIGHCFEIAGHLIHADVAQQQSDSLVFANATCNAINGADVSAIDHDACSASFDELTQWAGVNAAAQILNGEWNRKFRRA